MRAISTCAAVAILLIWPALSHATVTLGQIDNFEDGTTMSWVEGTPSPNPPTNVATGGPGGANDNFVQNISGGSGAGGRQIMFNQNQWAGDYVAAGVTRVDAMLRGLGQPMSVRIVLAGNSGDIFASTTPFALPNDGVWRAASFNINSGSMTRVQGSGTLADALADVFEMRLLSSSIPSYLGDSIAATLCADNITAAPEPAAVAILGAGALLGACRRRR